MRGRRLPDELNLTLLCALATVLEDMSTKRSAPSKGGRKGTEVVESRSGRRSGLTAEEEKVVRMSRGLGGPDGLELEHYVHSGNDDVRKKLAEIESRAFQMSGRIDALRREAGITTADGPAPAQSAKGQAAKQKIVNRLREAAGEDEEATAKAKRGGATKPRAK